MYKLGKRDFASLQCSNIDYIFLNHIISIDILNDYVNSKYIDVLLNYNLIIVNFINFIVPLNLLNITPSDGPIFKKNTLTFCQSVLKASNAY